jgi:lipopolysaccharide export system protein LptC
MGERLPSLFILTLLVLLAALTYWLDRAVQGPPGTRDKPVTHDPDYLVEKLLATRMGLDGRIRDTLHAAKMVHYPDNDSTELILPRFASFAHAAPLRISAGRALVSSNGENIYFYDDVRATRSPYEDKSEFTVVTQYLHLLPDDSIVKTDRAVTLGDATITIEAVGMELNNETRVLKLNDRVRAVYHDPRGKGAGKADRGGLERR